MFVSVLVISYQNYGPDNFGGRQGNLFIQLLGITLAITTAIVGTFSRGEKPWPWLKTGLACLVCWVATVSAIAFLVFVFIRPH